MARRGRTFGIRRQRKAGEFRWGGDTSAVQTLAAGALFYNQIIIPSDYQQTALLEVGASTLVRIRGALGVSQASAGDTSFAAAVFVGDTQAMPPAYGGIWDPRIFGQWVQGDLLWHTRSIVPTGTDNVLWWPIDIKRKAKLENDTVVFVLSNDSGANSFRFIYSLRCLLRMP